MNYSLTVQPAPADAFDEAVDTAITGVTGIADDVRAQLQLAGEEAKHLASRILHKGSSFGASIAGIGDGSATGHSVSVSVWSAEDTVPAVNPMTPDPALADHAATAAGAAEAAAGNPVQSTSTGSVTTPATTPDAAGVAAASGIPTSASTPDGSVPATPSLEASQATGLPPAPGGANASDASATTDTSAQPASGASTPTDASLAPPAPAATPDPFQPWSAAPVVDPASAPAAPFPPVEAPAPEGTAVSVTETWEEPGSPAPSTQP